MPSGVPRPVLSRDRIRDIDRRAIEEFGIPGVVLMENAGRGLADVVDEVLTGRPGPVVILTGKGNNGGDGFVAARHLTNAGRLVALLHVGDLDDALARAEAGAGGDWGINLRIAVRMGLTPIGLPDALAIAAQRERLRDAGVIVDALLGTGLRGEVRDPYRAAIHAINDAAAAGVPVVAADLPSGLDADTGAPLGAAVRARITVTFAASKQGFVEPGAREHTGEVVLVGIGCPASLLEE